MGAFLVLSAVVRKKRKRKGKREKEKKERKAVRKTRSGNIHFTLFSTLVKFAAFQLYFPDAAP